MVFSAENSSTENDIDFSAYGYFNSRIRLVPLLETTRSADEILVDLDLIIYNCTETTLNTLLSGLKSEVMDKVDAMLLPMNVAPGTVVTTDGYGAVNIRVSQKAISNPSTATSEIHFQVEVDIVSVTRSKLDAALDGLQSDIMAKIADVT